MFTGLVQDMGVVDEIAGSGPRSAPKSRQKTRQKTLTARIRIRTRLASTLTVGDSLAVNGVCLTVTSKTSTAVTITAVAETLSRSTLGELTAGARVNLEPALRVGNSIGGHLVQGHVDGMGRVTRIARRGESVEMTFEVAAGLSRYLVEKGSVAIDGISLTIAAVDATSFRVALVPHTLRATTIGTKVVGDAANIEIDMMAKYVERLVAPQPAHTGAGITLEFLKEHGYA